SQTVLPALLAAIAGGVVQLIWGLPAISIAAAVLGALAGSLISQRDDAVPASRHQVDQSTPECIDESERGNVTAETQEAMNLLPIGVLVVSPDRQIVYANAAVEQIFGLPELTERPVLILRARRLLDCIDACLKDGEAAALDFTLSRTSDTFLAAQIMPMESGNALITLDDRTHARMADELHRDFVANASHELKTPLAAVQGIIETLLGHAKDDPEATERFLGMLSAQTQRMAGLIGDLMSLNRIEMNERVAPEECQNVIAIVAEVAGALSPIAEESGMRIEQDLGDTEVKIDGDHDELAQLFRNLIDNAIKYGGEATAIRIQRAVADSAHPGMIGIAIQDHGHGIEREHLPRLTERFYRVNVRHSREKGGTGLGLAIVKHIVNRHRGRLDINSTVGEGSTFTVWLPIRAENNVVEMPRATA
ncbi:MAG: ATP-binding protein, partial [Pseudomonadota bacterium]